jgi:UPF0716 protein FxsA
MHDNPRTTVARPRGGDQPSGDPSRTGKPGGSAAEGKARLAQALGAGHLVKLVGVLLVFILVPLAEIFLFIYIGHLVGNFLVLVLAVLAGATGALLVADQAGRLLSESQGNRSAAPDPMDLAGLLAAALLLVTPGFITDLCGFALLVPRVRRAVGKGLLQAAGPRLRAALERAGPLHGVPRKP